MLPMLLGRCGWEASLPSPTRRPGDDRSFVSAESRPGSGQGSQPGPDGMALTRSPGFWRLMGYAALFGVVLAFASLAFLGLIEGGTDLWFTLPKNPGWFDGSLWWVAVTAAAGVLVGVLRRLFRLPAKLPGTVEELKDQRVEPSTAPKAVAVSLVSLAGGASLGPEGGLGLMGGGLGTWVSERKKLSEEMRATNTLTGMSAAYGGLLSAPILATILVLEIARPKGTRFSETLVGGLLASSVAFAVYFPIAGSTFVGIYSLPSFKYEDWQLLAAVPLGLVAGALALITMVAIALFTRLAARLGNRTILRSAIGGVAFGLVGVALPLTLFTGTDQLKTVIDDGAALGAGLLIAVVFAKILVFALCEATGFIGGPFLVMLFIGGTAGITAHLLIPGLPEGLAFTAMFAALPGALVAAPFSLILLGVITTQIGALQTVPVTIAVISAYLAVSGSGLLIDAGATATQARRLRRMSKDTPAANGRRERWPPTEARRRRDLCPASRSRFGATRRGPQPSHRARGWRRSRRAPGRPQPPPDRRGRRVTPAQAAPPRWSAGSQRRAAHATWARPSGSATAADRAPAAAGPVRRPATPWGSPPPASRRAESSARRGRA